MSSLTVFCASMLGVVITGSMALVGFACDLLRVANVYSGHAGTLLIACVSLLAMAGVACLNA